jgi:raffinose/stachyose/melibiose transport system substrate-binding protein
MKRLLATALAVIMVISLAAGCGGTETTTTKAADQTTTTKADDTSETTTGSEEPSGPVEITVVTSYGGDDGNRGNYEDAVSAYEEATGNTVLDASATSDEEWKSKVMTDFEAGTEPDVLFYFNGVDANPIIEGDKVVSLDEIREEYPEYADNMKEDLLVPSPVDGKVYTVPVNGFWESLFINKAVLEEAGVEIPGADYDWETFMADWEKIKEAGFTPVAVSLQEVPHYWFEFAVYNRGNQDNHLNLPASSDDETGAKWAEGLGDIKALYEAGYLPDNTLTASDAETVQLLADGDAAFLIDGSWKIGYFQENCADNLDDFALAYVPGQGERKATDLEVVYQWVITSQEKPGKIRTNVTRLLNLLSI